MHAGPDPDSWWHSLSEKRRHQIYRWVNSQGAVHHHPPTPGQHELFDIIAEPSNSASPPADATPFHNEDLLVAANAERARTGAARQLEVARQILADGAPGLTDAQRQALEARVAHPDASLPELAAAHGMNKDAFWSLLRRATHRPIPTPTH